MNFKLKYIIISLFIIIALISIGYSGYTLYQNYQIKLLQEQFTNGQLNIIKSISDYVYEKGEITLPELKNEKGEIFSKEIILIKK